MKSWSSCLIWALKTSNWKNPKRISTCEASDPKLKDIHVSVHGHTDDRHQVYRCQQHSTTQASICTSMQPWGHFIISGSKELMSPWQACSSTAHMVSPENERKRRPNYVAPYTYRDTVALTRGACTTNLAKRKWCPSSPEPEEKKPFIAFGDAIFSQTMAGCKSGMVKRCRKVLRRAERHGLLVMVPIDEHNTSKVWRKSAFAFSTWIN